MITDPNWIINGARVLGKEVGDKMSEEHRIQMLTVLRDQATELHNSELGIVTCPCGKKICYDRQGYRCFFCDVIFCKQCAAKHFANPSVQKRLQHLVRVPS